MKIAEVVKHFLRDAKVRNRSEKTLHSYEQHLDVLVMLLEKQCSITELELVKVVHLRQCVEYLMSPDFNLGVRSILRRDGDALQISTVRLYIRIFKVFFRWCYQEEFIQTDPTTRLHPPKAPEYIRATLTSVHLEKMLESCDLKDPLGFRDYVILLLMCDTGVRLAEICSLKVEDVHDTYIKVFGKGRKEREIGIHPDVSKLLWKYIHKFRPVQYADEPRLFIGRKGPLDSKGLHEMIKRKQAAAGLTNLKISPHVFRHTFAKMYLERGGELFKLSRELGHSEVKITEVYLKDFNSTNARKEHTSFSPIENLKLKKQKRKHEKQE